MKDQYRKITKTERQLYLYHIFSYCQVVEYQEITNLIPANSKMIERDIKDLTDAGLISVKFSKSNKGFVKDGEPKMNLNFEGRRPAHLLRLNRLGTLMLNLETEEVPLWDREEDEDYSKYKTCIDSYYELFPDMSERTRQRDFETLCKIGYTVKYDNNQKYFFMDFPSAFMEIIGLVRMDDGIYQALNNCY